VTWGAGSRRTGHTFIERRESRHANPIGTGQGGPDPKQMPPGPGENPGTYKPNDDSEHKRQAGARASPDPAMLGSYNLKINCTTRSRPSLARRTRESGTRNAGCLQGRQDLESNRLQTRSARTFQRLPFAYGKPKQRRGRLPTEKRRCEHLTGSSHTQRATGRTRRGMKTCSIRLF
jgi:hypothetical protein